ncbi:MAG: hypothetical protein ABIH86_04180 [Planctomycetota bacterium]
MILRLDYAHPLLVHAHKVGPVEIIRDRNKGRKTFLVVTSHACETPALNAGVDACAP